MTQNLCFQPAQFDGANQRIEFEVCQLPGSLFGRTDNNTQQESFASVRQGYSGEPDDHESSSRR